jgi:CHAD domain-containing protein
MEDLIKAYYLEHKTVFDDKFKIVLDSFDEEAIHKMRTSTKRLRALFQLIEFISANNFKSKKQLKKIRSLFVHAGKIREIQIEKTILSSYENTLDTHFPAYREYLKQREHREIARFLKSIPKFSERNKIIDDSYVIKTILNSSGEKLSIRVSKFLNRKLKQLSSLNSKPVSNVRIHKNRTILKQIYYLYDILSQITKEPKILNMTSERMREIEQMIGNWHDLINSTYFLNNFFQTKNGVKSADYKKLKHQIIKDRNLQRKEIVKIIKKEVII